MKKLVRYRLAALKRCSASIMASVAQSRFRGSFGGMTVGCAIIVRMILSAREAMRQSTIIRIVSSRMSKSRA